MNKLKIKVSKCFTAFYIIKFLTVENNIEIVFIELSFIINRLLKINIQKLNKTIETANNVYVKIKNKKIISNKDAKNFYCF